MYYYCCNYYYLNFYYTNSLLFSLLSNIGMFILQTDVRKSVTCRVTWFIWYLWINKSQGLILAGHNFDIHKKVPGYSPPTPPDLDWRRITSILAAAAPHARASAAWMTVEAAPQKSMFRRPSRQKTAIDCQSASLIRGAECARGLIITCWSQVHGAGTCWSSQRCSSDGSLIHAHNKHCNQGRHFSRAKCLIHNSSLKITISVETEEGWL